MNSFSNAQRAEVLTQALPYIQKYVGQVVVVKYGGNAMLSEELQLQVMKDLVLLSLIGVRVVLVHGGGPEISETMARMGGSTVKMKYGHRGVNQPVTQVGGPRTFITSQNHGYAVVAESLAGIGQLSFVNANDGSCEGVDYPGKQCFSVQFHPEACPGPQDTGFLFDRFLQLMKG